MALILYYIQTEVFLFNLFHRKSMNDGWMCCGRVMYVAAQGTKVGSTDTCLNLNP